MNRWFISYREITKTQSAVITDVTPAQWILRRILATNREHYICYAEQVSLALASELIHRVGIKADFYKEED